MNSLRYLMLLPLLLLLFGCEREQEVVQVTEEAPPAKAEVQLRHSSTPVVVPDFVVGNWKAVKIEVSDKEGDGRQVFVVPIGGEFDLPGSDLKIRVLHFLPHFVMDGKQLTSRSNRPENPAVNVQIVEAGQPVFDGWLFSNYPRTHPFKHPRFGFSLVGYVPVGEKGVDN
ncbi:MAG: hypothetical protein Kow00100_03190 [Geothermobacteraceae bacterium]